MNEQGVVFRSGQKQLVAIEHLSEPVANESAAKQGVVLVVGGPQTRVGSHRLFVSLARELSKQGIAVFRFDYSGAGDSEGELTEFTAIQTDIDAAINCFIERNPQLTKLCLWGLCDAASAILLYLQAGTHLQRNVINSLVLVNPWVRQEHTQAKTYLRSYYVKRLLSKEFWTKFLSGKVATKTAFTEIQDFKKQSRITEEVKTKANFVLEMFQGLKGFSGQCHILLSGNDLTADEFSLLVKTNKHWRILMAQDNIYSSIISKADHTFSQQSAKNKLIELTSKALVE